MIVRCIIILCCCFCARFSGLSQSGNAYFDNTVDRFNYAVTRYLVGNLTDQRHEFDNRFRLSGNLYGSDTNFKRIRYAIPPEHTRLITLSSQLDSIKANYPDNISLESLPYFLVYSAWSDRIKGYTQTYRYPLLNEFFAYFESTAGKKFTNFQYQLYKKLLTSLYHNEKPVSDTAADTLNDKNGFRKWLEKKLQWVILGIAIFLVYLVTAIAAMRNRYLNAGSKDHYSPQIAKLESELSTAQKTFLEQTAINNGLKEKLLAQEMKSAAMTEQIRLLNEQINTKEKSTAGIKTNGRATNKEQEVTVDKPERPAEKEDSHILYFPPPNKVSGRFSNTTGNPAIQSYSVYKFTISNNSKNNAKVELISIPRVTESVLNFPEFYIHHACEAKGDATNAKRISTITPGKAVLEGGEWMIEKPAIIQYE